MKKIAFILPIIITFTVNAQKLKLGILANPQITWMSPTGSDDVKNEGIKPGIDIGLSMEKYFTDNYAILTGISLNNMGGKISYNDSITMTLDDGDIIIDSLSKISFSLQYIKVPVGLKFKTKEIGYFTYFAQIGLEAGINVKANLTADANGIDSESVSDEVKNFNTGYFIGAGTEYSLGGNSSIVLGIQYQNGFIDVLNTTKDKIVTPKVTLLLGIMF